jgi:hypothetical protein
MSDIETVVMQTRKLESLLKEHYHAEGKGLHQLISSSESRLPHELIPQLRYMATIRNKILHEDGFKLDDRKQFLKQANLCIQALTPRAGRFVWRAAWGILMMMTLGSLIFYYLNWEMLSKHLFE